MRSHLSFGLFPFPVEKRSPSRWAQQRLEILIAEMVVVDEV